MPSASAPSSAVQLVPGVGGLLQALVGRDLAGQGLTEERMEGSLQMPYQIACRRAAPAPGARARAGHRPTRNRLDDLGIVEQWALTEPESLLDGPPLGHRIAAIDFTGEVLDEVPDGVDDLRRGQPPSGSCCRTWQTVALVVSPGISANANCPASGESPRCSATPGCS